MYWKFVPIELFKPVIQKKSKDDRQLSTTPGNLLIYALQHLIVLIEHTSAI